MQTLERPQTPEIRKVVRPRKPDPRDQGRTAAGSVLVTMVVCLGLWAVLSAPNLERGAEAGPLGARRSAALTILRPLASLSRLLFLSDATGTVERALGNDPRAPAGGELVLPELDLPPQTAPGTKVPSPARKEEEPAGTSGAGEPRPDEEPEPPAPEEEEKEVEPLGIRIPTGSNRLRIAVIGDSLSQGLGPAIERWLDPDLTRVLSLGQQSSGLTRQDYFNWLAGMRRIVDEFRPDLVFVMLGSNDGQDQVARDGEAIPVGTFAWVQGYRDRVSGLLREATNAGSPVVWVGIPVVSERWRWDLYRRVNGIYREAAGADPLGTYVDSWSAFDAKDGGYTAFVRNERGELQEMRASDGIHFTPTGYDYLGRLAIRAAVAAFDLPERAVGFRI